MVVAGGDIGDGGGLSDIDIGDGDSYSDIGDGGGLSDIDIGDDLSYSDIGGGAGNSDIGDNNHLDGDLSHKVRSVGIEPGQFHGCPLYYQLAQHCALRKKNRKKEQR